MSFLLRRGAFAASLLLAGTAVGQTPAPSHSHPAPPQATASGAIRVENAWARATAGQAGASGAFLTVQTSGGPDRLVGAASPVARKVELHETTMEGTIMRMRPVAGIDIAPGKPAELKPGGLHIMLIDLPVPLKAGDSFPLTLTFAHAPPVTVTVKVVPPGGAAPHSH